MKRRHFLKIAGIGGLLAGAGAAGWWSQTFESAGAAIIQKELGFLPLDKKGVADFMRDYAVICDPSFKRAIRVYRLLGVDSSRSGKVHQMVTQYLLSTDFFKGERQEADTVRYVALYNPYLRPCAHPFNHLQYPAA